MIDHVILTVSVFKRSVAFYAQALKPLGITAFLDFEGKNGHPDLKGFGDGKRYFFWLKKGKPDPRAVHVGFVAKNNSEVDAFYKAALAAGGKSKERGGWHTRSELATNKCAATGWPTLCDFVLGKGWALLRILIKMSVRCIHRLKNP